MKKTRLVCLALATCLCSVVGVFAVNSEVARAEVSPITELFKTSGITLDAMQIDPELLYEEKALRLTSFDEEETVEWKQNVSGTFSFDYMPVTQNGDDTAKTFVTQFTDISDGDEFKVVIEHGATIEVSVEFNNVKAGTTDLLRAVISSFIKGVTPWARITTTSSLPILEKSSSLSISTPSDASISKAVLL